MERAPARHWSGPARSSLARSLVVGIAVLVATTALVSGAVIAAAASDDVEANARGLVEDPAQSQPAQHTSAQSQLALHTSAQTQPELDRDTIEGEVTTAPVDAGGHVAVGTDSGVYAIEDGTVTAHVETRPVRALVAVGDGTVIALVDDQHYPNVLAVDVAAGEIRWRHAHEREVYSRDFGAVERQVPAFDATAIGDVTGDGTVDVALTAGRSVVGVDGGSGRQLWSADDEYNVWTVAHADGDVYAGTQGGRVVALAAADGERSFARQVAPAFENDRFGSIPRSVWDVEPIRVGGAPRLAAATENGDVLLLERDDGDVAWRQSLIEWNDEALGNYYAWSRERQGLPTYPGDANFRNVELTTLEDGTQTRGLAATVVVSEQAPNRGYQGGIPAAVYGIDVASGDVTWSAEDLPLAGAGPPVQTPSVRGGSLLVPTAPAGSRQRVATVDPRDGSVGEPIEVPSVPSADRHGNQRGTGYIAVSGDELVVASSAGDVVGVQPDDEIAWSVPSLRSATVRTGDLTGDGTDDALLTTVSDRERSTQSRAIAVRDGTDGSLAWSAVLGLESFFDAGGYEAVRPIPSGSGEAHVVALRQPLREGSSIDDAPPSVLEVRDGATGAVVASHELVNRGQYDLAWSGQKFRPQSMAILGDVTGNGNVDVLLGGYDSAFVLDARTGDVVWERSYRNQGGDGPWQPVDGSRFQFHDVETDDDVADVAVASPESGQVALLETNADGADLSFEVSGRVELEGSFHARYGFRSVGDRTGDGTSELLFVDSGAERPYRLYDPVAGRIETGFQHPRTASVVASDADLTGDGRPATIVTEEVDDSTRVSVVAGTERVWSEQIGQFWTANQHVADGIQPAAPAGDVTGDGTAELALVTSSPEVGARVEFYDVAAGERVETLELASWEDASRERFPALHAERIPDQTGDGQPELGVVAVPDQAAGATPTYYVVDPQDGEVLVSGEGVRTAFTAFEDGVGIFAPDGTPTVVDVTNGVTLSSADAASPVELSWSFADDADYVTTVTAGGRPVALTTERSASLRLPAGRHTVAVEATRPDGVTVHDSVAVTADADSSGQYLLYGATGGSVLLLVAFGAVPAVRRRVRR